ncbi:MAG: hypothetical protein JGK01_09045 [Microcoleus sp. PH2017_03_ELD_O_A]|uniref:hypothetical protein n=1 Tax=Microcoleus sp. PH2017_39_LGB_O_B TaxID=2798849 RepID=UPI001DF9C9AF|nr:hypothetical protein [Microcoleus sp. PH2017_39_LGB_O_B]MCC3441939.1 hypothetical protein [Microcoleus sp. PH2017_03_ELD_O_A]MCC3632247.1 hypothetical protein [Microcoleus sp. PH2017_39_LGB_O_B]
MVIGNWYIGWIAAGSRLDRGWIAAGSRLDRGWIAAGSRLDRERDARTTILITNNK